MKSVSITAAMALACLAAGVTARADDLAPFKGVYAGFGGGVAGADHARDRGTDSFGHHTDGALRLFAGYQFDRHFGIEGGYLRTGHYTQTVNVNDVDVRQSVKSHAWYAAGTARLPIGTSFALTGTIGAAFGKVNGDNTVTGPESLLGTNTSVLAGIGAQYRVSDHTDLQLDMTGIDKVSQTMSAGVVTLSIRKRF
jgi:OOP family OmpA-OmpF porin